MRKSYLLLAGLLFLGSFSFGQITITDADLPQAGYTFLVGTDTTPSVSIGIPSASSQSWDFSSLSTDYPSSPYYGPTSATAYAAAYPTSNHYTYGPAIMYSSLAGGAPVNSQGMNNGYMFWRTDTTGFWTVGFRADSGSYANKNVHVNPNELIIPAPCTYGSTFNNSSSWTVPMNDVPTDVDTFYVSRTTKTMTGDAWGNLVTPTGSYSDVLRIHEYLIKTDTVHTYLGSTLVLSIEFVRDTLNNYIFMTNGIHYPLAIAHCDKNNVVKDVEYYTMTLTETEEMAQHQPGPAYPNPASGHVFIPVQNPGNYSVEMLDATGMRVRAMSLQAQKSVEVDLAGLPSGIYFVSVKDAAGNRSTSRISVRR